FTLPGSGTFTFTTSGYPPAAIVKTNGNLPGGVTYDESTRTLAGTPAKVGTYPMTFTASNGISPNAVQAFRLVVGQAPAFTSADHATFTVGANGTFSVTTTGYPAPSIVRTGDALPSGVTFAALGNGTGILSGTPAAHSGGAYELVFTASNGG